jgi:hypothetical protein
MYYVNTVLGVFQVRSYSLAVALCVSLGGYMVKGV